MEHSKGQVKANQIVLGEMSDTSEIYITAEGGRIIAKLDTGWVSLEAMKANAERIAALWNAADGLTTEQAVLAVEFGKILKTAGKFPDSMDAYYDLMAKIEAES